MSAVVDINNGKVSPASGEPYPPLVEMLTSLLEKAESGEIQAAAMAYMHSDGCCTFWISGRATSFGLLGALESAKHAMFNHDDE